MRKELVDGDVLERAETRLVKESDIIIFLTGSRYGSLYDESRDISVTRKGYRHAKTVGKQCLVFVVSGIWSARSAYKSYLKKGLPFVETSLIEMLLR